MDNAGEKGKLERLFFNLKHNSEYLNWGRDIIVQKTLEYSQKGAGEDLKILDIGMGWGTDLINIRQSLKGPKLMLFGVECFKPYIDAATYNGVQVFTIDLEKQPIPLPDRSCDIVIANQIIEHTKEIFWVLGEISRVLKTGGIAIVGMQNLAALHNRLLLLGGKQPTCIKPLSEHVRGFTKPAFERFIESGGYFKLTSVSGSNFYPFPLKMSRVLSRYLPTLSTALFYVIERTPREGNYVSILESNFYETPYFKG